MKKTTTHSKAILDLAKSLSLNSQNYTQKGSISFSLFKVEILSGLTVALALVPEAIAFCICCRGCSIIRIICSFYCWVNYSCFLVGRPGMISGATGALAVVMVSLVS